MKILVVDDHEENRRFISILLTGRGHSAVTAVDGEDGLQKLQSAGFDLIISDILMPIMDGFRFIEHVRANNRWRNIPFAFFTGTYLDNKDEELAYMLGADAFLRKPIDPEELVRNLEELGGRKRSARDKAKSGTDSEKPLRLYNESMVHKLEKKMADLEKEIAQRKQAQEALRTSEEKYRLLVNGASETILVSQDGLVKFVNPKAAEVAGYELDEFIGMPLSRLVHPDDLPDVMERYFQRLKGEHVTGGNTFRVIARDGSIKWQQINAVVIDWEGKPATLNFITDVTARKKAEDELRQALDTVNMTLDGTINALALMSELRDPYTAGHQRMVAEVSVAIAEEMQLSKDQIKGLRVAGLLHDVGKMYVPAEILSKPGKLTELEMGIVRTHAEASYEIVRTIIFPWPVGTIVRQHHERMNGSGYPLGLKEEDILLESRILAVADVVEAMVSHRPYRPALGLDMALEEIMRGRGTLFDARTVDACMTLFREKGYRFSD